MTRRRKLTAIGVVAAISALIVPTLVFAGGGAGNGLKAQLTGAQIVPAGQGAPEGSGKAKIRLKPRKAKVCYRIRYKKVGKARRGLNAGIYSGGSGQNGNEVVGLFSGYQPSPVKDCAKNVTRKTQKAIKRNPQQYHVTVKSAQYSQYGAVRGQLKSRR